MINLRYVAQVLTFIVSAVVATSSRAQAPIFGGDLFSALPGLVTAQLVGSDMSRLRGLNGSPPSWSLPLYWRTGPGGNDFSSTGNPSPRTGPQGVFGSSALSQGVGTTLSTPSLSAGTEVLMAATSCCFSTLNLVAYTGSITPDSRFVANPEASPPRSFVSTTLAFGTRQAAIFPGPDNTVRIGFTASGNGSPLPMNFLDYPIRVLMSNVCVK